MLKFDKNKVNLFQDPTEIHATYPMEDGLYISVSIPHNGGVPEWDKDWPAHVGVDLINEDNEPIDSGIFVVNPAATAVEAAIDALSSAYYYWAEENG